jgi:hypothetical protein
MTFDMALDRRHIHNMDIVRNPADRLARPLQEQKFATMPELKASLGTSVWMWTRWRVVHANCSIWPIAAVVMERAVGLRKSGNQE